jgi:GNAT superfamily N-acetyltransferase
MREAVIARLLGPGDATALDNVAADVFEDPIQPQFVKEFLNDSRHHLEVAVLDGPVIGMATGVHYLHPDKPNAFWINETGIASTHQTQGIGRPLMKRLLEHAKALGCG